MHHFIGLGLILINSWFDLIILYDMRLAKKVIIGFKIQNIIYIIYIHTIYILNYCWNIV